MNDNACWIRSLLGDSQDVVPYGIDLLLIGDDWNAFPCREMQDGVGQNVVFC